MIVDELARQLIERGHEVTHVTSSAGAVTGDQGTPYRVLRVAAMNPLETRLGVPYPIFGPRLLAVLRREIAHADVVHAHGFVYPGTVAAFALARRAERPPPLVLTEHVGHVPYGSALLNAAEGAAIRILGRRVLRRADVVVTYNDRVGDQLSALCPSIERQTILNGVDHRMFHPAESEERNRLRAEFGGTSGRAPFSSGGPSPRRASRLPSRRFATPGPR